MRTEKVADPRRVTFELTMRCNLNCRMCFRDKSNKEELTLEDINQVIDNLKPSVDEISLIGGEIFLRSDIFDILDLLRDRGFIVNFHTNGTLIDEDKVERLSEYDNFKRIGFSLDGTRELHNKIRGSNSAFDKTIEGIKLMAGAFPTAVNSVIMGENIDQLEEIFLILNGLGAVEYRIEPEMFSTEEDVNITKGLLAIDGDYIITQIKEDGQYDYPFEKFQEVKKKLKGLSRDTGMRFNIAPKVADIDDREFYHGTIREKKKLFCKHLLVPRIDAQGGLIFCHLIKKEFGNLADKSLEEVWNSGEIMEFRKKLLRNNLSPVCKRCCRLRSI